MGTAPLSKLSDGDPRLSPATHKIDSKRSLKRKYSLKKKKNDSKRTKPHQDKLTLLQYIACRDWENVVTRASSHQNEVASIYRTQWCGVSWEVLPIHLACALGPTPQVVAALLSTKENKEVLAATPMRKSTKVDQLQKQENRLDLLSKKKYPKAIAAENQSQIRDGRKTLLRFPSHFSTAQTESHIMGGTRGASFPVTKETRSTYDLISSGSKSLGLSFNYGISKTDSTASIMTRLNEPLQGFPWRNIRKSSVKDYPLHSPTHLFYSDYAESNSCISFSRHNIHERQHSASNVWQECELDIDTSSDKCDGDEFSRSSLDAFLEQEGGFLQIAPTGVVTVAHLLPGGETFVSSASSPPSNEDIEEPNPSLPVYPTQEARKEIKCQEERPNPFLPEPALLNCKILMQDSKRLLPIHIACLYRASSDVIALLLDAYKMGSEEASFLGMLPIHLVCADIKLSELPIVTPDGHASQPYSKDEPMDIVLEKLQLLIDANPESITVASKRDDLTPFEYFLERELGFGKSYEACLDLLGHLPISNFSSSASFDTVSELGTPTVIERAIVEAPSDEVESNADSFQNDESWHDTYLSPLPMEPLPTKIGYPDPGFEQRYAFDEISGYESDVKLDLLSNEKLMRELQCSSTKEKSTTIYSLLVAREWDLCVEFFKCEPGQAQCWHFGIGDDYYSDTKDQLRKRLPIHIACSLNAPIELVLVLVDVYPKALSSPDPYTGSLPLHLTCQLQSNPTQEAVILAILQRYPNALKVPDGSGKLPLHLLVMGGASLQIVNSLVRAYPEALLVKDANHRLPLEYARAGSISNGDYDSDLTQSPALMFSFLKKATTEYKFLESILSLEDFISQMLMGKFDVTRDDDFVHEVCENISIQIDEEESESFGVDTVCL